MDDDNIIHLPGGGTNRSRNKRRVHQPCNPQLAIRIAVLVDDSVTIEADAAIHTLGRGEWIVMPLETWKRTVEIAVKRAAELPDETPEDRAKRRLLQSLDRRN